VTQRKRMASTKKADALFSKAVRSRGKCEMAGLFPKIKCNGVLQCAHIISRRYRAIRWDVRQSALQLAPMDAAAVIARLSEDREEA
jgi:hypothetical protein